MSAKIQVNNSSYGWLRAALVLASLLLGSIAACAPVVAQPVSPAAPTLPPTAAPTATPEVTVHSGWETYTSQRCAYMISYPPEMQVTNEGMFSQIIGFKLADPDEGARNFIYVSVIPNDLQSGSGEDVFIYNGDPAVTGILLNMQVGESKQVHGPPDVAQFYTYTRNPDVTIDGYTAKKFENTQPWEFPIGTKEIRYYLQVNKCTYLIGGYMDTTGSTLPGAISEDLFNQIISTFQVVP
jgi:hypothetical protein